MTAVPLVPCGIVGRDRLQCLVPLAPLVPCAIDCRDLCGLRPSGPLCLEAQGPLCSDTLMTRVLYGVDGRVVLLLWH